MDYENAWEELKQFVITNIDKSDRNEEWVNVISYSEILNKMYHIEREVILND